MINVSNDRILDARDLLHSEGSLIKIGLDVGTNSLGSSIIIHNQERNKGLILWSHSHIFREGVIRDNKGRPFSKNKNRRTLRSARKNNRGRLNRINLTKKYLVNKNIPIVYKDKNIYDLRKRAIDGQITLPELACILLYFCKHRGFLSTRKCSSEKDSKFNEAKSKLEQLIAVSGSRTVGEFFQTEIEKGNPVRNKDDDYLYIVTRQLCIFEFEIIWNKQKEFYPEILTDDYKKMFYDPFLNKKERKIWLCKGSIFGQKKATWANSSLGKCSLEPGEKRCLNGLRCAQEFRILKDINNLRITDIYTGKETSLTEDQRGSLFEYLKNNEKVTSSNVIDLLKLSKKNIKLNIDEKITGNTTDIQILKKYPEYDKIEDSKKDILVSILLNEDSDEDAIEKIQKHLSLTKDLASNLSSISLPDSRLLYSKKSINKLLPFLRKGHTEYDSKILAGYKVNQIIRSNDYNLNTNVLADCMNPIAKKSLTEAFKTLNGIIQFCKEKLNRTPDLVCIELARSLKMSLEKQSKLDLKNKKKQKDNEDAKAQTKKELKIDLNKNDIKKYLLWKEQGYQCLFSGENISISKLFSPDCQIAHILPKSRFGDDGLNNKCVVLTKENQNQKDRTVWEWLQNNVEKYNSIIKRAKNLKLSDKKIKNLQQQNVEISDFINRQLCDTSYIAKRLADEIRSIGLDVQVTKGGYTHRLVRGLGNLYRILGTQNKRDDHRHHAIDAIVIALTSPKMLREWAESERGEVKSPWESFSNDLQLSIDKIKVSNSPSRKLKGELHDQTFYGKIKDCDFRYKVLLSKITESQKDKIIDDKIKQQVKSISDVNSEIKDSAGRNIKKVRITVKNDKFKQVSSMINRYINPSENYCILYYKENEKINSKVISRFDANENPNILRPDGLVFSLTKDEIIKIDCQIFIVRKIRSNSRITVTLINDARPSSDREETQLSAKQLFERKSQKISIDRFGNERLSND